MGNASDMDCAELWVSIADFDIRLLIEQANLRHLMIRGSLCQM